MTATMPRSFHRAAHQVPITYSLLDSEKFYPARTHDFSSEGLRYETREPLTPGADVCIVMGNYTPGQTGPEGFQSYVASIRWTRQVLTNGTRRYISGARLITRSHDIITRQAQLPHLACDLCGAPTPLNKLELTQAGAHLCNYCMKHYRSITTDKIRQCVERFLLGNVI